MAALPVEGYSHGMSEEGIEITPERVKCSAVHESGHAAVALYLNRTVVGMSAYPHRQEDEAILRGFCSVAERVGNKGDHGFLPYEEDLIIAHAASIAEAAYGIRPTQVSMMGDLPAGPTAKMLEALGEDRQAFWRRMDELRQVAHEIVNKPETIEAIKQISQLCIDHFGPEIVSGDLAKEAYLRGISKGHLKAS